MPQHDAQARDGAAGSTPPGTGSLKARFVALRTLRPFAVAMAGPGEFDPYKD